MIVNLLYHWVEMYTYDRELLLCLILTPVDTKRGEVSIQITFDTLTLQMTAHNIWQDTTPGAKTMICSIFLAEISQWQSENMFVYKHKYLSMSIRFLQFVWIIRLVYKLDFTDKIVTFLPRTAQIPGCTHAHYCHVCGNAWCTGKVVFRLLI